MKKFVRMSFLSLMLVAAFGMVWSSCSNDDDKPSGSEERSIVGISFDGQVGNATITRTADKAEVTFTWNTTSGSAASIEVKTLSISDKATCSVKVGDKLNFDNAAKSATITVTAENGTKLDWKVIMDPFTPAVGSDENDIVSISFVGQLGDVTMSVAKAEVTFLYNTYYGGIGSIEVASIKVSDKASASVAAGGKLNFNNATKTASITVTSESGLLATWLLTVTDISEPAEGKWNIKNMWLWGGPPKWGGSAVFQFKNQKTWNWDGDTGPKAEFDNVLEIVLEGIDLDGNNYGTFTNDAGDDGLYADFLYGGSKTDLNNVYRRIPAGCGTWMRNADGAFVFISEDDEEFVCDFGNKDDFNSFIFYEEDGADKKPMLEDDGTDLTYDVESLMRNYVFMFDVQGLGTSGALDWDNIPDPDWGDTDKFSRYPLFFWVEVEKIEK